MVQIIGFIIAVYTLARLAQVPIQMLILSGEWRGTTTDSRWTAAAVLSGVSIGIIASLTLLLLFSGV